MNISKEVKLESTNRQAATTQNDSTPKIRKILDGAGTILHHATFIWSRICCIKDDHSFAAKIA